MKTAIVLLADGFEEVEAITPIDFLRRAGITVTSLSISDSLEVRGGHDIVVKADGLLKDWRGEVDAIVVPGGGVGSKNLAASHSVAAVLKTQVAQQGLVAAICAAPVVVLGPLGILDGKKFTCFPGMETSISSGKFSLERVVQDGQLICSRAAGTSAEFAEAIIAALLGPGSAQKLHGETLQKD